MGMISNITEHRAPTYRLLRICLLVHPLPHVGVDVRQNRVFTSVRVNAFLGQRDCPFNIISSVLWNYELFKFLKEAIDCLLSSLSQISSPVICLLLQLSRSNIS